MISADTYAALATIVTLLAGTKLRSPGMRSDSNNPWREIVALHTADVLRDNFPGPNVLIYAHEQTTSAARRIPTVSRYKSANEFIPSGDAFARRVLRRSARRHGSPSFCHCCPFIESPELGHATSARAC